MGGGRGGGRVLAVVARSGRGHEGQVALRGSDGGAGLIESAYSSRGKGGLKSEEKVKTKDVSFNLF